MKMKLIELYSNIKVQFFVSMIIMALGILLGGYLKNNDSSEVIIKSDHDTLAIFWNNLKASLGLMGGLFSFGITTLFSLLINGVAIGESVAASSLPKFNIIMLLIPHGIFEVPALLISSSIGFYSIKLLILFLKKREIAVKQEIFILSKLFILTLFLLIVAAFIEANITALFVN